MENFKGDWAKARIANARLSYTWDRLSYHLWKTSEETKNLSKNLGFNYPYQFKQYILISKNNNEVEEIILNLRNKLKKSNVKSKKNIDSLPVNQLLNFALRHSESRIADFNK